MFALTFCTPVPADSVVSGVWLTRWAGSGPYKNWYWVVDDFVSMVPLNVTVVCSLFATVVFAVAAGGDVTPRVVNLTGIEVVDPIALFAKTQKL
jgi:hypothetical protein